METKANTFLKSENELNAFLAAWEAGTLPKPQWTHAAHVAVAACYTWQRSPAEAFPLLRERIRAYNLATGGQNTADSGYHETLTRFWADVVGHFVASQDDRLTAVRSAVEHFGPARDLFRSYYEHDVVRNPVARREWVAPEKADAFAAYLNGLTRASPGIASPDKHPER